MAARFWQSLPRQSELSCAFHSIIRHTSNSARTIRTDRRPSPPPPSRAPLAPLPPPLVRALATIATTVVLSRSPAIATLRSGARRRVSNRVRSGRRWKSDGRLSVSKQLCHGDFRARRRLGTSKNERPSVGWLVVSRVSPRQRGTDRPSAEAGKAKNKRQEQAAKKLLCGEFTCGDFHTKLRLHRP